MMNDTEEKREIENNSWSEWFNAFLIVAALYFIYLFFQNAGWMNSLSVENQKITLGISFLIGLVASFSSCLAVVGSMVVAFSEKYDAATEIFFDGVIRPNLFFHIGRLVTFFTLGGVLGAVGGTVNLSGSFVSVYTLIIAVVMGWLGLSILGILPSVSSFGLRPPKSFTKFWARAEKSEHRAAPFLLGGITFFLPCGFTQSMQILALASGSFWQGAAALFIFALGTAPVLMLLGITASWGKAKKLGSIKKAAGILVLVFAVFTMQSGLALQNVKTNVVSSDQAETNEGRADQYLETAPDDFQTVEMRITNSGFQPSVLTVRPGVPVRWVIKGDQVSGCTNRIIVPSLGISKNIASGDNIVVFNPKEKGQVSFSCGMGMVRGKFIVQ